MSADGNDVNDDDDKPLLDVGETSCGDEDEDEDDTDDDEKEPSIEQQEAAAVPEVGWWQLACLTSWTVGLNYAWSAMFIVGTPLFKTLGLSNFLTSFAWLAGPLSGLIFQPIVGALSDRTRLAIGRRRPYVIVGAVVGALGMLGFASPLRLAEWLGGGRSSAIGIAIAALWVMNIGLNIVQGPATALLFDNLPARQQAVGQSVLSVLGALAGFLAAGLGSVQLTGRVPFASNDQEALFAVGLLVLLLSCAPTVLAVRERHWQAVADDENNNTSRPLSDNNATEQLQNSVRQRASVLARQAGEFVRDIWQDGSLTIVAVYFLLACGSSPFTFFGTDMVGTVVYHGDPDAATDSAAYQSYQQGVRTGSLAFLCVGVVDVALSMLLPWLLRRAPAKLLWAGLESVPTLAMLLLCLPLFQTPSLAVLLLSTLGIDAALTSIMPFSLMAITRGDRDAALMVSILNSAQVVGQIFGTQVSAYVVELSGSIVAGVAVGSLFLVPAIVLILRCVRLPDDTYAVIA